MLLVAFNYRDVIHLRKLNNNLSYKCIKRSCILEMLKHNNDFSILFGVNILIKQQL